jgi:hypothetical protein
MLMEELALASMLQCLGCRRKGFPQTYLGLPFSNIKLNLVAFFSLISKADR